MKTRIKFEKYSFLALVCLILISQHIYPEDSVMDMVLEYSGYICLAIAALGRIWSSAYIAGRKNHTLVTVGPYSMVRNPLYLFSFIGFLGAGMVTESVMITLVFGLVFFATHWATILEEERRLGQLFSDTYGDYAARVPRFIPQPWLLNNPDTVAFSPRTFTRALLDSSLIVCAIPISNMIEWAHLHSLLPVVLQVY